MSVLFQQLFPMVGVHVGLTPVSITWLGNSLVGTQLQGHFRTLDPGYPNPYSVNLITNPATNTTFSLATALSNWPGPYLAGVTTFPFDSFVRENIQPILSCLFSAALSCLVNKNWNVSQSWNETAGGISLGLIFTGMDAGNNVVSKQGAIQWQYGSGPLAPVTWDPTTPAPTYKRFYSVVTNYNRAAIVVSDVGVVSEQPRVVAPGMCCSAVYQATNSTIEMVYPLNWVAGEYGKTYFCPESLCILTVLPGFTLQ